jgi:transposase
VVDARQALRGVQLTVAVTIVAEWGDLSRFDKPTQLRSSLGLTPSAYSTGAHRRQGAITKTGTAHARRALIEGAWASRSPATVSRHLPWRLAQRPTPLQDISGRAQVRLCTRDRPLRARGTPPNRGVVAIARELSACMGAMAQQVPATS